jgi:hypothetical protein
MIAKSIFTKGQRRKSGSRAGKVVELTSGDLTGVRESGLRVSQGILTADQESAAGIVGRKAEGPNGAPLGRGVNDEAYRTSVS